MGKSEVPDVSASSPSPTAVSQHEKSGRKRLAGSKEDAPVEVRDKRQRTMKSTFARSSSLGSPTGSDGSDPAPQSVSKGQSEPTPPRFLRSMAAMARQPPANKETGSTGCKARKCNEQQRTAVSRSPATTRRRNQGTIPSAVTVLFTKLKSKEQSHQVQALHALHKLVLQGTNCVFFASNRSHC
jgi:hypothetical protein